MVSIRLLSGAYFGNIKQLAKSDQLPYSKLRESHLPKGRKRALNSIVFGASKVRHPTARALRLRVEGRGSSFLLQLFWKADLAECERRSGLKSRVSGRSSAPGLSVTGLKAVATITIRAAAQMRPDCPREAMGTVIGSLGSQVDESRRGATGVANPD